MGTTWMYGLFKCKIHGLQLTVRTVRTVGGREANKRINQKNAGSKRIGCFLCLVWVKRNFFLTVNMGITWTVCSL
jgi:hypothetical protein